MIPFLSSLSLVKLDTLNRDYGTDQDKTIITQLSLAELFKNYQEIKDDNNLLETISFEKVPENQLLKYILNKIIKFISICSFLIRFR